MIRIDPAEQRYYTEHGPVGKAYFSFSFEDYYDPEKVSFGPLRVLNDDFGVPGGGLGMHPHRDMEIVTLMIEGGWLHRDSLGNECVIRAGEIQRMTAGQGIWHSEHNISQTAWNNGFQMWFLPEQKGLEPGYEQVRIDFDCIRDQWVPYVRRGGGKNIAHIHQDMGIYLSLIGTKPVVFEQRLERRTFLMSISGAVRVACAPHPENTPETFVLRSRDATRITEISRITCVSADSDSQPTYAMLIDLP